MLKGKSIGKIKICKNCATYWQYVRGKKSTLEKFCRFLRIDNKGTVIQLLDRLYRRFETDPVDCFKIEAFRKFYSKRNPETELP